MSQEKPSPEELQAEGVLAEALQQTLVDYAPVAALVDRPPIYALMRVQHGDLVPPVDDGPASAFLAYASLEDAEAARQEQYEQFYADVDIDIQVVRIA